MKKTKVLCISDHPMSASGVGIQTKYMIEALIESGNFSFVCLAGAVKHQDYRPITTEEYGQDMLIIPVDGYGNADLVRAVINDHKPDILWFMSDPRFYMWLWEMEDEIRAVMPIVYYHVWDNYPLPTYNKVLYESNDYIASISKLTNDVVKNVAPDVQLEHIPHTCNDKIFRRFSDAEIEQAKKATYGDDYDPNKMTFFWNNRNARRKQSGTLIFWFKEFLDRIGHDKAQLIMHTDPKDSNGQDLEAIIRFLGLDKTSSVRLSTEKIPAQHFAMVYNMVDCAISISDAEGFGLFACEANACEVPIIVNKTGGLQEQVVDGVNGFAIEPASKAVIGSQTIPWIYEDRVSKEDFIDTLEKFYNLSKEERRAMGKAGRAHYEKTYSYDEYKSHWLSFMTRVHDESGSWETRKNYKSWRKEEI